MVNLLRHHLVANATVGSTVMYVCYDDLGFEEDSDMSRTCLKGGD
jgi:hypothetical protein